MEQSISKKKFIDHQVFFPDALWYEDISVTCKLLLFAEKVTYIQKPLYNYVMREGSIMTQNNNPKVMDVLKIIAEVEGFFKSQNQFDKYQDEIETMAVVNILAVIFRIVKIAPRSPRIVNLNQYIREHYPKFTKNPIYRQRVSFLRRFRNYLLHKHPICIGMLYRT